MIFFKILDPKMCSYCRFRDYITAINKKSGQKETIILCKRKDCDNKEYTELDYELSTNKNDYYYRT